MDAAKADGWSFSWMYSGPAGVSFTSSRSHDNTGFDGLIVGELCGTGFISSLLIVREVWSVGMFTRTPG